MIFALWCALIGVLLITMALTNSLLARLPTSTAMLYLAAGVGLGPAGLALLRPDPFEFTTLLEHLTEVAVLISLFVTGLKLSAGFRDRRWRLTLRLAIVSMVVTIALITVVGTLALGLSLGGALLLGAILAPTDPVLASDVQVEEPGDRDRVRFSLSGEGGLNDGVAFPFVMLGLGLLGVHDLGAGGWRWLAVDAVWATVAGLAIGAALGQAVGRLFVFLRVRHQEAVGLDEFLALGLIALAYGAALLLHAYGFLAVFAAGLALRRVGGTGSALQSPFPATGSAVSVADAKVAVATNPAHATAFMAHEVLAFNQQLERIGEVGVVLVIGAMLTMLDARAATAWFVPLLLLVIRPVSVWLGLLGADATRTQRGLISWFGIRGIGSIYYLMFAIDHGIDRALADTLISLTLTVVATSIVVHGVSVTPLMRRYRQRAA